MSPAGERISVSALRGRGLLFAVALIAVAALLPVAVGQASATESSVHSLLVPAADYADLNSPQAHILFGSPLPQVEIEPTANTSLGALLSLDYLLELAPNTSNPAHPLVVAEAAPETLQHFNGSVSPVDSDINLIATLPVYPADTPLWSNGTSVPQTTHVPQQAILDVNYSVAAGSDGSPGVLLSWSVSGWPWAATSGDELALEYSLEVVSGLGFETCTGAPSDDAPAAACTSQSLVLHQAVWGSALTALKGSGPGGSEALVSWSTAVGGSAAPSTPVTAGAYLEQPGTSELVVAAAADGAGAISGSTLFLLWPGAVANVLAPLVGDLPIYGGAAGLFAVAAGVGIFASRRRDRTIARELSE